MNVRILFAAVLSAIVINLQARPWFTAISTPEGKSYPCGTESVFRIKALENGEPCANLNATVSWLENNVVKKTENISLNADGTAECRYTMNEPGNLILQVTFKDANEKTFTWELAGVAYDMDKVMPARDIPADWQKRWQDFLAKENALPLNMKMEENKTLSTTEFKFWQITADAGPERKVYAYYIVPAAQGKHPLIVNVPGAGPNADFPEMRAALPASFGGGNGCTKHLFPGTALLVLNVMNYDPFVPGKTQSELMAEYNKTPGSYFFANYDNDKYSYLHVAAAHLRILDEIAKRPEINTARIGYYGFSQGGWFGLILGALSGKFHKIVVMAPGGCDMFSADAGRGKTWPYIPYHSKRTPGAVNNAEMLDGANMIRFIECPLVICTGLSDNCVIPSGIFAAKNVAKRKDVKLVLLPKTGHSSNPTFVQEVKTLCQELTAPH